MRGIVLAGAGKRAFASGADISEFDRNRATSDAVEEYDRVAKAGLKAVSGLSKPSIAAVQGYCIGGGLALALAADLRIAAESSEFGIPAVQLGLGYDFPGILRLVQLIGPARTKQLFFTGRRISAAEALTIGLVEWVVPDAEFDGAVESLTDEIVAGAPMTIASAKFAVETALQPEGERDLVKCSRLERACFASRDYAEGRLAFAEKRRPVFVGR